MPMMQGPIYWAKVTGEPQPGFTKSILEWSFDLGVTDNVLEACKKEDVTLKQYIKPATNPKSGKTHASGMDYIKFIRKAVKADGTPGKPFKVVDNKGRPWPEDKRIGNGSIVNVKFSVQETPQGNIKPSAIAIQVWELKEFEGDDAFPIAEDDGEAW